MHADYGPNIGNISIYIASDTLCISSIENNLLHPAKVILEPGQNIFELFKSFKPAYADYPALNALLTDLKMLAKGVYTNYPHNPVTFKNNSNFLANIIRLPEFNFNEFAVTIANSNMLIICPVTQNDNLLLLDEQVQINPALIKHELANSLNIINMSSILLNSGLNSITGPNETVTKLDKYSQIIKTELEKTISLLNTVDTGFLSKYPGAINKLPGDKQINRDHSPEPRVKIQAFYEFVLSYLVDINKLYPVYDDGQIYIDNPVRDSINNKYIAIQLPWIKIVLDNIFKNIYGHLGNKTNKKFKSLDLTYNNDLQQLIINVYNELCPEITNNVTKCELYTELLDKYNLIDNDQIIPCKQQNTNQGLNLISILCSKLNISWSLIEISDTIYLFKLAIPVHNSAIEYYSGTAISLMCRNDYTKSNNKYNIYLNDRIPHLHSTTI